MYAFLDFARNATLGDYAVVLGLVGGITLLFLANRRRVVTFVEDAEIAKLKEELWKISEDIKRARAASEERSRQLEALSAELSRLHDQYMAVSGMLRQRMQQRLDHLKKDLSAIDDKNNP